MAKLSLSTWARNAAAVFCGRRGDVNRQAEPAECSRQTVYQHVRMVEERLAAESVAGAVVSGRAPGGRKRPEMSCGEFL